MKSLKDNWYEHTYPNGTVHKFKRKTKADAEAFVKETLLKHERRKGSGLTKRMWRPNGE